MSEDPATTEFERRGKMRQRSALADVLGFLWSSRKWWLWPLALLLVVLGGIGVVLGNTAADPFVYTLF